MKKILLLSILVTLVVIILNGCWLITNKSNKDELYNIVRSYDISNYELIELFDISLVDVIKAKDMPINDVEYELNLYSLKTIADDLISINNFAALEELTKILDEAGYNRVAIYGIYSFDNSSNRVHKTNSDCIESIDIDNLEPVFCFNYYDLLEVVEEGYLQGYSLCERCFDE